MIFARITGTGGFLPGLPISNDELIRSRSIDSSSEWIRERSGIQNRHFAAATVLTSDLAKEAAEKAIAAAGRTANDVDMIIVATTTPDVVFPSVAAILQDKLGVASHCPAVDVQAVCSGFSYALTIAEKFVRTGDHRCVLVVGAETFSRLMDWRDRSTCVLFGDGAGAVVLEASDRPGILASALHADGRQRGILSVPGQVAGGVVVGDPFLRMDGQAVFKYAVKAVSQVADEVLQKAGLNPSEIDVLVPHQANVRIIKAAAQKLGLRDDQCVITIRDHGNTSAASIPLALDCAVRDGRLTEGMTALLIGVGGGFTWGANLIRM